MEDIIISFKNVSKQYYLYKSDGERFRALFSRRIKPKVHQALTDVSFDIRRGEAVGILGNNGAGKSTLLKMVTGVCFPTKGEVAVRGSVAALLELTAGFSPEMTGRENIRLKGNILGLTETEIDMIADRVIKFADLGEYIDQPVRTYSSGMSVRLGFAININIEPEILVVDEAMSVGDAAFRMKCKDKVDELIRRGITVLYVSHALEGIRDFCSRAIYLERGRLVFDGPVDEALELYRNALRSKNAAGGKKK